MRFPLPQTASTFFQTLSVLLALVAPGRAETTQDALRFFEEQVRPVLSARCYSCHGSKKQESDLRLDDRNSILQGGASGDPAAVTGDTDASLMLQYVRREVEGMEMPPDKPLSAKEVAVLERWVERGIVWPEESISTVSTMDDRLANDRASHWAFQPVSVKRPSRQEWPAELRRWPRNTLDEFVADKLVEHAMSPSEEANRRTLFRRLKFDLLGLPPAFDEVAAFEADKGPDAWERLVDQYIASPAYGERWGRHWLDVARYADTRGYTFGGADRNYAWSYTYRDYVINAFNEDLAYDEFVVQQLAADRLELGDDNRALAALGFLTVGRKFNNRHDDIDDLIDAVTRGFVGLTVACARCHDHKYDAIPTEDYYSLYGVFNSSRESGPPLIGDAETLAAARGYEQRFNEVNGRLSNHDKQLQDRIREEAHTKITEYLVAAATAPTKEGLRPQMVDAWKSLMRSKAKTDSPTLMPWAKLMKLGDAEFSTAASKLAEEIKGEAGEFLNPFLREAFVGDPPTSKTALAKLFGGVLLDAYAKWKEAGGNDNARRKQPAEVRQLLWYFFDPNSPAKIDGGKVNRYLTSEEKEQRKLLQGSVAEVRKLQPVAYHRAMVVTDNSTPSNAQVFIRGNAARRGDSVPRRGPRLFTSQRPYENGSGRFELAKEITHPDNPLTARVIVNRVWMHHFGKPLVATPSDFGIRCKEPKQRELLDYLADLLVNNNWSIKALHREILLSATYRQSSDDRPECFAVDPENWLLWKMNRRRLEFEVLRDALLSVGGSLDRSIGGKPVRQFRKLRDSGRRSVYGYIDRQDLPNLLRVFDFAGPDASAEMRANTTVPQQALFMLNSPFVVGQAKSIASAIRQESDEDFVVSVYRRILGRNTSAHRARRVDSVPRNGRHERHDRAYGSGATGPAASSDERVLPCRLIVLGVSNRIVARCCVAVARAWACWGSARCSPTRQSPTQRVHCCQEPHTFRRRQNGSFICS